MNKCEPNTEAYTIYIYIYSRSASNWRRTNTPTQQIARLFITKLISAVLIQNIARFWRVCLLMCVYMRCGGGCMAHCRRAKLYLSIYRWCRVDFAKLTSSHRTFNVIKTLCLISLKCWWEHCQLQTQNINNKTNQNRIAHTYGKKKEPYIYIHLYR